MLGCLHVARRFPLMHVRLIYSPLTAVDPETCLVYPGISVIKEHTLEL